MPNPYLLVPGPMLMGAVFAMTRLPPTRPTLKLVDGGGLTNAAVVRDSGALGVMVMTVPTMVATEKGLMSVTSMLKVEPATTTGED